MTYVDYWTTSTYASTSSSTYASTSSYPSTYTSATSSTVRVYTYDGYWYEVPGNITFTVSYAYSPSAAARQEQFEQSVEPEDVQTLREAQHAEYQRQAEERQAERASAAAQAEALLWACLDIVQRGELAINNWFIVTGSSGKRYRIRRGHAGNVEDYEGENIYSYCGHAYVAGMPEADQMLAQKFALETDEEGYRRIANATFLRRGTPIEQERADSDAPPSGHPEDLYNGNQEQEILSA